MALFAFFAFASWHRLVVPNTPEPHPNVTTDLPQWQRHPGPKPTLIQKTVGGLYIIPPRITLLFFCPTCNMLSSHTPYKSPLALTKLNNLAPLHILFSFPYFLHLMIRKRLQAHCCQGCQDEKWLSLSSQGFFCCFVLLHVSCPDFDLLCYE